MRNNYLITANLNQIKNKTRVIYMVAVSSISSSSTIADYAEAIRARLDNALINTGSNSTNNSINQTTDLFPLQTQPLTPSNAAQFVGFNLNNTLSQTAVNNNGSILAPADTISLSPLANNLVGSLNQTGTDNNANNDNFSNIQLTQQDQSNLNNIIDSFQDTPFSTTSFNQLQIDLANSGLTPLQLATRYDATQFDSTQIFFGLLNSGGDTNRNASIDNAESSVNRNDYIMEIIRVWRARPIGEEDVANSAVTYNSIITDNRNLHAVAV